MMKLRVLLKIDFFTGVIASIVSTPFLYLVEAIQSGGESNLRQFGLLDAMMVVVFSLLTGFVFAASGLVAFPVILDSAVGRARVCRCRPPWEGATTLRTFVRKAEQGNQGGWQRCNRVRSALTWRVRAQNRKYLTMSTIWAMFKRSTAEFGFNHFWRDKGRGSAVYSGFVLCWNAHKTPAGFNLSKKGTDP